VERYIDGWKNMTFNIEVLKQTTWLIIFSMVLLTGSYFYQQQGSSAVVVILLLILLLITVKLLSIHTRSKKQIEQVIKALANNDPMLGLPHSDPLATKIAQVREKIFNNRLEAEVQAQYFQTLLVHIDIAILVVNTENMIVHKNPASEKLLGSLGESANSLGQLSDLISTTNNSLRATIHWQKGEQLDTLSVHISNCKIQGKSLKLVSIQSIYQALLAKEQQAYKRLTKVLTHEVANSITPLASLAHTAIDLLPEQLTFDDPEDKTDLNEALVTLASRTSQLSTFIKSFHQITALPKPNLQKIELPSLIERILTLFKEQTRKANIKLSFNHRSSCLVVADGAQLEQALINIIKNALEAVSQSKNKEVTLTLYQQHNKNSSQHLLLDIEDTGPGIAPHVIEQIFVPFFTTKKQGSGIGLSLSRQIMIQHGGDLKYVTKPDCGACFRMIFG
jgi:nitrogen fixation/metabolism regulation signal transduction histidine kinase